jgi:(p)ppGpp synthase/HD superfamily hydrolase
MDNGSVFTAVEFAAKAHSGQYRKGTRVPYIIHPLGVAKILIEYGCEDDLVIAGVLHDTVEDTAVTPEDIARHFGERIKELVEQLSEPDKSDSWENRKTHTIEHLKEAPLELLLGACADKLDNLESIEEDVSRIGEAAWARFNRPKEKQRWYYRGLAEVFEQRMEDEVSKALFGRFIHEVEKIFG